MTIGGHRERVEAAMKRYDARRIPKKRTKTKTTNAGAPVHPKESKEQALLVKSLDALGLDYTHVPNEGKRSKWGGHHLFGALGAKRHFPDMIIFNRLPNFPEARGLAIEMKRVKGSSPAWGCAGQHEMLETLSRHGWIAFVCRGHQAALYVLEFVGFSVSPSCENAESLARQFIRSAR